MNVYEGEPVRDVFCMDSKSFYVLYTICKPKKTFTFPCDLIHNNHEEVFGVIYS